MIETKKQLAPLSKGKAIAFPFDNKKMNSYKKDQIIDWVTFIGPAFILFTIFFTLPLIQGLIYSMTDWNGVGNFNFVGLRNYKMIIQDNNFLTSIGRTFYIAAFNVVLTNVIAMLFAVALTTKFKFNNLMRGIIFLPNMIGMAICGFIWKFMFDKVSGTIYTATGMELFNRSWLTGSTSNIVPAILIVTLWQGVGYIMTIYIAGLLSVDDSILEAASIDGANGWQSFFRVKLPLMLPMVTVGAFLNLSGSLKMFDVIFSLTSGGPGNATEVAMLNVYREAFVYNKFGYGSAKAVILSMIIIIITLIQLKATGSKEVQQ